MPNKKTDTIRKHRPRAGRPTREQSERRHEELLDHALEQFLEKGFVMTTMDAIASSLGMTKPTIYSLYKDKEALFLATVQRAIQRWNIPVQALYELDREDLEGILTQVARIRMNNAVSIAGIRLQSILNAEAYRFPTIFTRAYEQGTLPTITFLADVFRHHAESGAVRIEQPEIAATAFLAMVVGGLGRAFVWGLAVDEDAIEDRIHYCVRLFLDGVRPRPTRSGAAAKPKAVRKTRRRA